MSRSVCVPLWLALIFALAGRAAAVPAVTATVPIGPHPVAVTVDSEAHRVYVADVDLGAVIPFDAVRGVVAPAISVGGQPSSLAIDSRGRRLFVGNRDVVGAAVTAIDLASGRAQPFLAAGVRIHGLAFDPEINRLYAGNPDNSELMMLDGASGQVSDHLPLGGTPAAVAVNQSTGEVAVAVQGPAPALVLMDPNSRAVTNVPVTGGQPMHVDVDTGTGKFFVTRGGPSPALLVLRPGSSTFDNEIAIAAGTTGLAIDSRTSRIYLAHAGANLATVIDGASGKPVDVLPLGDVLGDVSNHAAVDMNSTPTRVYIVDTINGALSILTDQ